MSAGPRCGHPVEAPVRGCTACALHHNPAVRVTALRRWGPRLVGLVAVVGVVALAVWGGIRLADGAGDDDRRAGEDGEEDPAEGPAGTADQPTAVPVVDGASGLRWTMDAPPVRRTRGAEVAGDGFAGQRSTTYVARRGDVTQRVVIYAAGTGGTLDDLMATSNGTPYDTYEDVGPVTLAGIEGIARHYGRDERELSPGVRAEVWGALLPEGGALVVSTHVEGDGAAPSAMALAGSVTRGS